MSKDWTGNANSVAKMLAASNLTETERAEHDYYATHPKAAELLLEIEDFDKSVPIWECASGENHLANVFKKSGYTVRTSDLIPRTPTTETLDFLAYDGASWNGNIITNPPFKYATEFVKKALEIVEPGNKVCMFLKLQFLETKGRRPMFDETPPKRVWVSSGRLICAPNGDFEHMTGSAVSYAWYVWEKGWKGDTTLKWFN